MSTDIIDTNMNIEGLDDVEISNNLTIIAKDGTSFILTREQVNNSHMMKTLIENDREINQININYCSKLVKVVVEFLQHFPEEPFTKLKKPSEINGFKETKEFKFINNDNVFESDFYSNLLTFDMKESFEFMNFVSYMDIPSLLELTAAYIAVFFQGKLPNEIKEMFN